MSLETWKAEFYPVPAEECPEHLALQHSLRKWEGLTADNLSKHGIVKKYDYIKDEDEYLGMRNRSCALCRYYASHGSEECATCPVVKQTGETCHSQWVIWLHTGDPQPMIHLLRSLES